MRRASFDSRSRWAEQRRSPAFGATTHAEREQAERFYLELMGAAPRRRTRRRRSRLAEDFGESKPLIEGALTDSEWQSINTMLSRGEADVGSTFTTDASENALRVAARIFCARNALRLENEDPLLCVTRDVTMADRRVRALVPHVTLHGPIEDWTRYTKEARTVRVMTLLVNTYSYPVNGAAGLVGNLQAESGVLPQRVEGSGGATPMRAANFAGRQTDFTADEIMNRNSSTGTGPKKPGIGLAQWTSASRRANLFTHTFRGVVLGPRILFDLDAQVDYLVTELRSAGFAGVQRSLTSPTVTIDGACDDVVYNFEIPGALLSGRAKLPRSDARVMAVFSKRRPLARNAERLYRAATAPPTP